MSFNILVVDDEPDMVALVRQRFRREVRNDGWSFEFRGNGNEALDFLKAEHDIDVVLSDINMPGMDGLTLLGEISELNESFKTIVVTAYSDLSNIRQAMNNGAYDFITKPINFEDLKATIKKAGKDVIDIKLANKATSDLKILRSELDSAREIQQRVLAIDFPEHESLVGSAFMRPAKSVGGDYYDFFLKGENLLSVSIGDVAGKGISAALYMAICTTLMQGVVQESESPGESLRMLNRLLFPRSLPKMFVTVLTASLDLETGRFQYCNAGHFPPVIIQSDGEVRELTDSKGPAVSLMRDFAFPTGESYLKPGDTVLLYTDGIPEARNADREEFQDGRTPDILAELKDDPPDELIRKLIAEVDLFAGDEEQADDMTLVVFTYKG